MDCSSIINRTGRKDQKIRTFFNNGMDNENIFCQNNDGNQDYDKQKVFQADKNIFKLHNKNARFISF